MKNSTELNTLDNQIATDLFGWERLNVTYWGEEENRQGELEEWLDNAGIVDIGDYFLDIENNFWIKVEDWNPTIDEKQSIMILRYLENNDWQWQLSNVTPGSDATVYEIGIWRKDMKAYACEYTIPLSICYATRHLI